MRKKVLGLLSILLLSFMLISCNSDEKYNVSFINFAGNIEKIEVRQDEVVVEPDPIYEEGSSFFGWYTDEDYTDEYYFNKTINEDLVLYAKFLKTSDLDYFEYEIIENEVIITGFDFENAESSVIVFPQKIEDKDVKVIDVKKKQNIY